MTLIIEGHPFHYEMENLCRIFFPQEKIKVISSKEEAEPRSAYASVTGEQLCAGVQWEGKCFQKQEPLPENISPQSKECERRLAVLLFGLLTELCRYVPPWGILTGIRPVKLLRELASEKGEEKAAAYFEEAFFVSEEKTALCRLTMHNEQPILERSRPESFSLYVSIPFCPTRCAYCSFVSQSIERTKRLIPEYVELLCREIAYTGKVASDLGLRLETIYIGGGTPTTLSAEQLTRVIEKIRESFDLTPCTEFTVEAGRPDTISREKLVALRQGGVTRISINPQTLNDAVLEAIGRRHTAQQALEAYYLARECGHDNINMDLIAGLPQDTVESFAKTIDGVLELDPENITVHTLALKRSSNITQSGRFNTKTAPAGEMLRYASASLLRAGYEPYYLYRQSRMVGNLENTGWSRPGFENCYNIYIMDETHTILACGAGAVSKIRQPGGNRLERIFNFKFPYEYISRHAEMMSRKDQVKMLYDQFSQ